MNGARWLGLALILLAAPAWFTAPVAFHAGWLAAWWFCLSIVLGAMSTAWIHHLTGGHWGRAALPAVAALRARLPWVLLAGLPWLIASPRLYGWWGAAGTAGSDVSPGFQHVWLQPGFFLARLTVYGVAWMLLTRWASPVTRSAQPVKGRAAAALLIHGFLTSLAAVDILMSLMPQWYSTAFGLVMLVSQGLAGAAMMVWWTDPPSLTHIPGIETARAAPVGRDLGNLMLMYVMAWAYLAFMEFLIIWAENLPAEIAWYLPRMRAAWLTVTLAIVLLQGAVPMLALLFRSVKDRPARVRAVALLLLAANGLYCVWLVVPSLPLAGLSAAWALFAATLITGGLALLLFGRRPPELRDA